MKNASLKEIAEKIVPRKYLREAGLLYLRAQYPFRKGDQVHCPCCNKSFKKFLTYGVIPRENALCPWCLSLERHRILWRYLEEKTDLYDSSQSVKVLHFAPEWHFQERWKIESHIDYLSCDLDMPTAMDTQDITALTYADASFNMIMCNHVLEHVPDDIKAMSELYRVLKPGGWAILQTPMSQKEKTYEDFSITDPKEREKHFGQNDHVRVYGLDKKDRLESVGFSVTIDTYINDSYTDAEVYYYGFIKHEDVWVVRKPL